MTEADIIINTIHNLTLEIVECIDTALATANPHLPASHRCDLGRQILLTQEETNVVQQAALARVSAIFIDLYTE